MAAKKMVRTRTRTMSRNKYLRCWDSWTVERVIVSGRTETRQVDEMERLRWRFLVVVAASAPSK